MHSESEAAQAAASPQLPEGSGRKRSVLYLMTFIMGGCGIAYEYTFSKVGSDLMGNSNQQWAITIGLMMFFMGIGSDLQKHLKDRGLFDKFIVFEVLLGLLGGFGPILLLWVFGAYRDHYMLVQYALIISSGFLIGLEIPILARINEQYTAPLRVNIGGILRMDYIGAFVGAVGWILLLQALVPLTQIGYVLGLLNVVTAALSLWYFRRLAVRRTELTVALVACFAVLAFGWSKAPQWTRHAEQALFLDKIVLSKTTKYQHIVLTKTDAGDVYCYINGNTQFASFDEHIYHEFLVHPAMHIAPKREKVLVLGGGDGLGVREILKYPDVESVTLVDLDPEMTRLAMENEHFVRLNRGALQDARVQVLENNALVDVDQDVMAIPDQTTRFRSEYQPVADVYVVNLDADLFVDQISGVYDVIIIDFPDPSNLGLAKLYSESFYQKVRRKLAAGGIVVQQSTSPVFSKEAFLSVGRTMEASGLAAVPFHENVPSFGEWGWWIAGRDQEITAAEIRTRMRSITDLAVPTRYITPELIAASLLFGKGALKTEETEINTMLNCMIYLYYSRALAQE